MTIDKSLRVKRGASRNRSVLTRVERIQRLREADKWSDEKSPLGLPKVRVRKMTIKKKKKKKEDEEGAAAEGGAAAPAAAGAAAAPAAEPRPLPRKPPPQNQRPSRPPNQPPSRVGRSKCWMPLALPVPTSRRHWQSRGTEFAYTFTDRPRTGRRPTDRPAGRRWPDARSRNPAPSRSACRRQPLSMVRLPQQAVPPAHGPIKRLLRRRLG